MAGAALLSRSSRPDDAPALLPGVAAAIVIFSLAALARVAVDSRRRRAALSGHHAEPALRRRPQDREQPHSAATTAPTSAATCRRTSIRRGRNGEMYSIHAPGLPALVLPAFAIGGYHGVVVLPDPDRRRPAARWPGGWRGGRPAARSAAWFGWAAVTLSAPFLLESYTVFPDAPGAVDRPHGFWALLRAGWDREAATDRTTRRIDGCRGCCTARRSRCCRGCTRGSRCSPATLGGLILVRLARAPEPAREGGRVSRGPRGRRARVAGFFLASSTARRIRPRPTAATSAVPSRSCRTGSADCCSTRASACSRPRRCSRRASPGSRATRRLALEWLVVAVPYLLAVGTYAMWWAGIERTGALPGAAAAAAGDSRRACAWACGAKSRGARRGACSPR